MHPADIERRLRKLVFRLLRVSQLPLLVRETLQRRRVTIVLYHDPDPELFERHLSTLKRLYSIVDLRTYDEALRTGQGEMLPPKALIVTLDDGHRRNRALIPVLERLGIPVTIFLCASIVGTNRLFWFKHVSDPQRLKRLPDAVRLERMRRDGIPETLAEREALSDREIEEMAGPGVDFQSHGLTHPILPHCDDQKARAEIFDSMRELTERYGSEVYAFSYPNGDYTERELRLVREAGYRCALTTASGFNDLHADPLRLKRICIDDPDGIDELLVKSSGVWGSIRGLPSAVVAWARRA